MVKSNKKGKKLQIYTYVRVWLTILVFLGHSSSLAITSTDFTVNIDPYVNSGIYVRRIMSFIINIIYSFHMPAFMMLSGCLFALTFCSKQEVQWYKKRVVRLLVPYLSVAFFFLLPIRVLVGYYEKPINYFYIIVNDIILANDINYLWYLLALFEINIIMGIFSKIVLTNNPKIQITVFLFLAGISVAQFMFPEFPFAINDCLRFLFWFYVGILFEKYRVFLEQWINRFVLLFLGGIWIFAYIVHTQMEQRILSGTVLGNILIYKAIKMGIRYGMELSGSLLLFGFAFKIKSQVFTQFTMYIEKNSFSIYLYHVPIMMLAKKAVQLIMPPQQMTEILYGAALFFVMIVGFIGSIGINFFVQKAKKIMVRN